MRKRKSRTIHSPIRVILRWILFIVILMTAILLAVCLTGDKIVVRDRSMTPTLQEGDELILDQLSYRFMSPSRFDVVLFPSRYQENVQYIRRIIGLPGETVQIQDGRIYINGYLLEENLTSPVIEKSGVALNQIILGADEYFVLCDDRNGSSADSRDPSFGTIKKAEIQGRVRFRINPLRSAGFI